MLAELLVEVIWQIFVLIGQIFVGSIVKSSGYLWRLERGNSVTHSGCSLIHT